MTDGYARYDYAWKIQGWTAQNPVVGYDIDTYVAPGLPADVAYVVVFGKFMDSKGRPLSGVVRLRTDKPLVHGPTGTRVMPGVQVLRFNRGNFTMVLPATDDPQLTPGFVYEMRLTVAGYTDTFKFSLPTQVDPVNVLSLIEASTTTGITLEGSANNGTIELGSVPQPLTVNLTVGADFVTSLEGTESWITYTSVSLRFDNGVTWVATLDGLMAKFDIDKTLVAAVPNGTGVSLLVVKAANESVWGRGRAKYS